MMLQEFERRADAPRPPRREEPADMVARAVMVAKIATGEVTEELAKPSGRVRSGKARGKVATIGGETGHHQEGDGSEMGVSGDG